MQQIQKEEHIAPRNDIEKKLCQLFGFVLGCDEGRISIHDDFFKMGGNSLLAIKLITLINNHYKSKLKVADIFIYKTVERLVNEIIKNKNVYQGIVKLNKTYHKPNMFMIHPGSGGCEVYTSFSEKLSGFFSCYGVDSYNLYNDVKITKLNNLANYYLEKIKEIMNNTNQKEYHLFGWSLGGLIATEIAYLLEQRGIRSIRVYAVDPIIADSYLLSLNSEEDEHKLKEEYKIIAREEEYDDDYIDKVISNMDVEHKIGREPITGTLFDTKLLLFKALDPDPIFKIKNSEKVFEYVAQLDFNNMDRYFKDKRDIFLEKIKAHHGSIMGKEDLLISKIHEFLKVHPIIHP